MFELLPLLQEQDEELEFERLLEEIHGTKIRTEVVIRLLGIQNCVDTVVGNAYIRGVSGGERKRVTSAEMLVGRKVCQITAMGFHITQLYSHARSTMLCMLLQSCGSDDLGLAVNSTGSMWST